MYVIEDDEGKFEFQRGKKTYSVTAFTALPMDEYLAIADEVAGMSNVETVKAIADHIEAMAPGSTEGLTMHQTDLLVSAYLKGVGIGLGE